MWNRLMKVGVEWWLGLLATVIMAAACVWQLVAVRGDLASSTRDDYLAGVVDKLAVLAAFLVAAMGLVLVGVMCARVARRRETARRNRAAAGDDADA